MEQISNKQPLLAGHHQRAPGAAAARTESHTMGLKNEVMVCAKAGVERSGAEMLNDM